MTDTMEKISDYNLHAGTGYTSEALYAEELSLDPVNLPEYPVSVDLPFARQADGFPFPAV